MYFKFHTGVTVFVFVSGLLFGLWFDSLQKHVGILSLQSGVSYFGEVHNSSCWNSLLQTFFLPITIYGFFTLIPTLVNANPRMAYLIRMFLYTAYIFHYILINFWITFWITIIFFFSFARADFDYSNSFTVTGDNYKNFQRGILFSFIALFIQVLISIIILPIQDVFGYWIQGDILNDIPNTIFYFPYFFVGHLFNFEYQHFLIKCAYFEFEFPKFLISIFNFFVIIVLFEFLDYLFDKFLFYQHDNSIYLLMSYYRHGYLR